MALECLYEVLGPLQLCSTGAEGILDNGDLGRVDHLLPRKPHVGPIHRLLLQPIQVCTIETVLFISYKFVKGFLAIIFLLLVISS